MGSNNNNFEWFETFLWLLWSSTFDLDAPGGKEFGYLIMEYFL